MDKLDEKINEAYQEVIADNVSEAKLTRQHFIQLAELMKRAKSLAHLKSDVIDWLKATNPRFDEDRFKKAAGIKNLPKTHE